MLSQIKTTIFKPAKARSLSCYVCSNQQSSETEIAAAEAVCSFHCSYFRGCGEPFCRDHGLVVEGFHTPSLLVNEEEVGQNEGLQRTTSKLLTLTPTELKEFRSCYSCLKTLTESRSSDQMRLVLLSFAAAVVLIIVFGAIAKALASDLVCSQDSMLSASLRTCFKKKEEPRGLEYLFWLRWSNPGVTKCGQEETYKAFLYCMCPEPLGGAVNLKLLPSGKKHPLEGILKCPQIKYCPLDGHHYFQNTVCTTSPYKGTALASTSRSSSSSICPPQAIYLESLGTCILTNCLFQTYVTSLATGWCVHCPLFKVRVTFFSCTEVPYFPDRRGKVEFYPSLTGEKLPCPENVSSIFEEEFWSSSRGYYSRKTYHGYLVCPVVFSFKKRMCEPEEMLIRHIIKCISPCEPCSQQWDYGLRKCVPGDSFCREQGLQLMSSGECKGVINSLGYLHSHGLADCSS